MKACVCVDYLSHEWSSTDLIQAHREVQRQKSKTMFSINTHTGSDKEKKKLNIERNRQVRYQNALWRQMSRSCTKNLSYPNKMIHPSTVNWQKESDVTWLYGPLYMPPESQIASDSKPQYTHPSLSFLIPQANPTTLKPVLKKSLPRKSSVVLQKDYWIRNDRYWSKCASESGKQSVRFHPDITEVSYLPETPVKESLCSTPASYFDLDSDNEDQEEDDPEEIWQVIALVGSYLKRALVNSLLPSSLTTKTISNTSTATTKNNAVTKTKSNSMVQLCTSAVSFTAWFMYQNVASILKSTLGVSQQPKPTQFIGSRKPNHVNFV